MTIDLWDGYLKPDGAKSRAYRVAVTIQDRTFALPFGYVED